MTQSKQSPKQGFTTTILHGDRKLSVEHGAVHKPIHTSTQYAFADSRELAAVFQGKAGYTYARQGTPTSDALEKKINKMEDGVASLSFATGMAALTALLIGLIAGPFVIRRLVALKIGQPIREYAMQTHLSKSGTPTMGGVLVLLAIAIATLLWADLGNRFVWIVLLVMLGFGAIGWADDWRKVVHKDPEGMRSRDKYLWQSLLGCWLRCTWCSVFLRAPTCGCWNFS